MNNKTGLLVLLLLILASSSFAQQSDSRAPEATTIEAALSFRDVSYLEKAFIDHIPSDRKDGILVGTLGVDGGNKAMILKLAQEIADGQHGKFDSFLIAHKGKLLFESYYSRGRINLPHPQASATKAYTSLALGRVIQLGYLSMNDLDKPLISFLKDLDPTKLVAGAEKITLNHAMTMRSGIRLNEEHREVFKKNPDLLKGQAQVQTWLEHSTPITSASQTFKYSGDAALVMQVIEAVVPGSAKDFIKNELLDKMGITNYGWPTADNGLPKSGSRSKITSRDMVKIGTLTKNKGTWNGEQLIPEAFIAKATSRILYTGDEEVHYGGKDVSKQGYGYFWWSADLRTGDKSYFSVSAQGGYGQFIILIQELDLMVVFTAHDNDTNYLQITAERILPAFIQNYVPTKSKNSEKQDTFSDIKNQYLGQEPPGKTPKPFAPGLITTANWEYNGGFSLDMNEYYFLRDHGGDTDTEFVVFEYKNSSWQEKVISKRVGQPFISPDNKIMHLGRKYKERTANGWSDVKYLDAPFKELPIMRLTASAKGTYYFDEFKKDKTGDIRYSRLIDGKHEMPKLLSKNINNGRSFHPCIAPDESYLLFDSTREGGYGDSDIYISFKQQDGSWGDAINLGDKINTDAWEASASITPDGKYLFFNRNMGSNNYENVDIFWVDAQIIETLRP